MAEPVLELRHISKQYAVAGQRKTAAVEDVSLTLTAGECLGLVGESGCGKTTLARIAVRLLEPSAGQVLLLGQDITHARGRALRAAYRQIQMVFQQPAASFDPRRTLGHGVGESLRNSGLSRAETEGRVAELLTACGLTSDFARRYPHEVSGGQCQRAAIARALAISPRVLICDEATSALDVTVQAQILALLDQLRRERGIAILLICHDLALVQHFCQRAAVMDQGRIVEAGTPEEVLFRPRHPVTRHLLECVL